MDSILSLFAEIDSRRKDTSLSKTAAIFRATVSLPADVVHALELSLEGRPVGPSGVEVGVISVPLQPPQLLHSLVIQECDLLLILLVQPGLGCRLSPSPRRHFDDDLRLLVLSHVVRQLVLRLHLTVGEPQGGVRRVDHLFARLRALKFLPANWIKSFVHASILWHMPYG